MTLQTKQILLVGALFALMAAAFAVPLLVKANPSFFSDTKETSTASSTMAFIRPGLATSTIAYDSLDGDGVKVDSLSLALQFTASSSAAQLRWRYEYAHSRNIDCVSNQSACDWYGDAYDPVGTATTTSLQENYNEHSWTFASSTLGSSKQSAGGNSVANKLIDVRTPTRFIRIVFYVPTATAQNAGVWAQLIPVREKTSR